MLDLGFSETSQNLSSFKQLLFSSFHRGDKRKKSKTGESPLLCISVFPITNPLFTSEMKSRFSFAWVLENWFLTPKEIHYVVVS